ncbi:MAG: hypothetical protein ACLR5P_04430 [[Eubacterium] siraeum]
MTAPYENAEFIELGTIMPPEKFRTVLPEDRDAPGGLTEQKVVIEFRRDSPTTRSFYRAFEEQCSFTASYAEEKG